jgi:hypothetical protein
MTVEAAVLTPPGGASKAIGRVAIGALRRELALYPKPGLVSPVDNGAHDDMTVTTFVRSLLALRFYFATIAEAGARDAPFADLQRLGLDAEKRMLAATGGVNTHRGAIFCLGFLAAAAGWRKARGLDLAGESLADTILRRWGDEVAAIAPRARNCSLGCRPCSASRSLRCARRGSGPPAPSARRFNACSRSWPSCRTPISCIAGGRRVSPSSRTRRAAFWTPEAFTREAGASGRSTCTAIAWPSIFRPAARRTASPPPGSSSASIP